MSTVTKNLLYLCLKKIGLNGFSGNAVSASNKQTALELALFDVLKNQNISDKHKVYRNLQRQNLVDIAKGEGDSFRVTISPTGAYRLTKESLDEINIPTMNTWDNKWRIVCYDLPSTKKSERYELTRHLVRMGFVSLQKSMWVHPYLCFEQIGLLADALLIKRYMTLLEVSKVDDRTTSKLLKTFQSMLKERFVMV